MSVQTFTDICVADPLALEITWKGGEVTALKLTWAEGKARAVATEAGQAMQAALEQYVAGGKTDWPGLPFAWGKTSEFSRQVLEELARVPAGQPVSYGWLAAKAGRPKAARAVGRVMASNPFPLLYPCHRVVGAKGALTGFGPGIDMKKYLLELEGTK
jgi:methylated-DNA-[protein]-cysteine S-methyltransferase